MSQNGYFVGREDALARRLGPLRRLTVFPGAVKGSRPELQAQSVQGRLEVKEFPSPRECERKRE